MIQLAIAHGWSYLKKCVCANPGRIYHKGRNQLTIFDNGKNFKLKRIGNVITVGRPEDLETVLTRYGL